MIRLVFLRKATSLPTSLCLSMPILLRACRWTAASRIGVVKQFESCSRSSASTSPTTKHSLVHLTRHGHPVVRLVPVRKAVDRERRRFVLEAARKAGVAKAAKGGPSAARSQDFLYGDDGLPK